MYIYIFILLMSKQSRIPLMKQACREYIVVLTLYIVLTKVLTKMHRKKTKRMMTLIV